MTNQRWTPRVLGSPRASWSFWFGRTKGGTFGPGWLGRAAGTVGFMFVVEDLIIGIGSRAAQARFANLLRGDWLAESSQAACEGGAEGLLRVGPAGPVAAKLVRVRFLDPVYRGDVMTVGLRWEAAGATGTLFLVLDANISISPAGDEAARLTLAGSYRPPLGRLGAGLDRAIMHKVATATIRCLLQSVAEALVSPAQAGHPAEDASPGWHPFPELGTPGERAGCIEAWRFGGCGSERKEEGGAGEPGTVVGRVQDLRGSGR